MSITIEGHNLFIERGEHYRRHSIHSNNTDIIIAAHFAFIGLQLQV